MQSVINSIVQSPTARAAVLIVLVAAISFYLGTSPVRRGILYYMGVSVVSRRHRRRAVSLELEMVLGRALDMRRADRPHSDSHLLIRMTRFSRARPTARWRKHSGELQHNRWRPSDFARE